MSGSLKTCAKCNQGFFHGIIFLDLEGKPGICGRCLFQALTGETRHYSKEMVDLFERMKVVTGGHVYGDEAIC